MKKITFLIALAVSFSLTTVNAQTILTEGFEGASFPPTGWTSFIGTNGLGTTQNWFRTNSVSHTGTYAAVNVYENVTGGIAEDWLVTSQIDLASASNTQLRFYSMQTYGTNYGSTYHVKVSTASQTNPADFTTVVTYNENTVGPAGDFELKNVDLSAYDGMQVYIAFVHYNDDGDNWIIDDIEVRSPLSLDAQLDGVNLNRYSLTSTNNPLSATVTNNGLNTITSLDISWSDGTNNYSQNFAVNIASGQTQTLNHSTQVNYATVDEKLITVSIDNVNGGADGDAANNSFDKKFNTLSQSGTKIVFIEEATGTWCGWCPRGAVGMDYMASNYPNTTALVAVHNADPMTVSAYDNAIGDYIGGYPSGVVDRELSDVDPSSSSLQNAYNSQINGIVPVDLSISATQAGSDLTITGNATFYTNFASAGTNFRLGAIITEDGVTGTGDGTNANQQDYDQVNYYAGGSNGAMDGYESLPNPVPATQMVYNHVGRALLGGFGGEAGSVPATITDGQAISHTFNYTIPASSDVNNMHIVLVLIDQDNGGVVGARQETVTQALLSTEDVVTGSTFKIYPNPVKENLNIALGTSLDGDYTISISDMLGRTVLQQEYSNLSGYEDIELPVNQFSPGQYLITVSNGTNSETKHFIVKE